MPEMIRRFIPAKVIALGDDECDITLATRQLALDDDIWDMDGGDLSHFETHPVLLFNHEPEHPVARASNIKRSADKITARATFAPAGVSHKADEVRGLVKAGILTGISAGILPTESEPLDPAKPRGGRRIKKWTLLEGSFVSVPADKSAAVTARNAKENRMAGHYDFVLRQAEARALASGPDDFVLRQAEARALASAGSDGSDGKSLASR